MILFIFSAFLLSDSISDLCVDLFLNADLKTIGMPFGIDKDFLIMNGHPPKLIFLFLIFYNCVIYFLFF